MTKFHKFYPYLAPFGYQSLGTWLKPSITSLCLQGGFSNSSPKVPKRTQYCMRFWTLGEESKSHPAAEERLKFRRNCIGICVGASLCSVAGAGRYFPLHFTGVLGSATVESLLSFWATVSLLEHLATSPRTPPGQVAQHLHLEPGQVDPVHFQHLLLVLARQSSFRARF